MQRLHRLLQLPDADRPVGAVGGVAAVGDVVVDRVVPPVEGVGLVLRHRAVVEHRHQLHAVHPQVFQVIEAGGVRPVPVEGGAGQGQRLVFAPQRSRHPAVYIVGKVLDVYLPDDVLGGAGGGRVGGPAVGVGAAQVDDHAAPAVPAAGPGPGVGGAAGDALAVGDGKIVVAAVQVAVRRGLPDAALAADKVDAQPGLALRSVCVEVEGDLAGGGSPQGKPGGRGGPEGAQGGLGVVLCLKGFGIVHFAAGRGGSRRLCRSVHGAYRPY